MKPVSSVTYEVYRETVLALIEDKELTPYIQEKWMQEIHKDPARQGYPIRTTVNAIAGLAAEARNIDQAATLTGYILPGSDLVSVRGGTTSIKGWRPNMLVLDEKAPYIQNMTVWGEHVELYSEKDKPKADRKRVTLPLYRKVTVIAEQNEWTDRTNTKRQGMNLRFLKTVHDSKPPSIKKLATLIKRCSNTYTIEQLNDNLLYQSMVLRGIKWRHAEGIDYFRNSTTEFITVTKRDGKGNPIMERNPMTNATQVATEQKPKPIKDPLGQPFIQRVIGTGEEGSPGEDTWTMKLQISPQVNDPKLGKWVTVNFENFRYAQPHLMVAGFDAIFNSARARGNINDPDPTKNPYAALNEAYRGEEIMVIGNFTRMNKSKTSDDYYLTFNPGLVMVANAEDLPKEDVKYPQFPKDIQVVGAKVPVIEKPEPEEEEEEEGDISREEQLMDMTPKTLKKILTGFREKGFEVTLRGSKLSLINRIMEIESGKVLPAEETMKEHDTRAKEEKKTKRDLSSARAKLLKKQEADMEPTDELPDEEESESEEEDEEDEADQRISELREELESFAVEFPDHRFAEFYGEDNDLDVFPDWVTPEHEKLVNRILEELRK